MSAWRLVLFITLFAASLSAYAQMKCGDVFAPPTMQVEQIIADLAQLRLRLDLAKSEAPSTPQFKALNRAYRAKEAEFIQYTESHNLVTRAELIARIKQEITKLQSSARVVVNEEEKKKEEQRKEIQANIAPGNSISFHPIEPGSATLGPSGRTYRATLPDPYQMANLLTTQFVWKIVLQEANRRFPGLGYWDLNEYPSRYNNPHYPVDRVSYEDITKWLDALNHLAAIESPVVLALMAGHQKGDVYRLPTENEWEFVERDRGARPGSDRLGDHIPNLETHAWIDNGTGRDLHIVATKVPLLLCGGEFYDFYGNVWQMTSTKIISQFHNNMNVRGGSVATPLGSDARASLPPNDRLNFVGFRLVRARQ